MLFSHLSSLNVFVYLSVKGVKLRLIYVLGSIHALVDDLYLQKIILLVLQIQSGHRDTLDPFIALFFISASIPLCVNSYRTAQYLLSGKEAQSEAISKLIQSQGGGIHKHSREGINCEIWLPNQEGIQLYILYKVIVILSYEKSQHE